METAEISRSTRFLAPSHYSLKVNGFSTLSKTKKYESGVFEAGGFYWKLLFYPNGDKENDGVNHISLYLEIVEIDPFQVAWEVNVNFKFFVHNQREDTYLMIQDNANGGVRRFHALKTKWGFEQLLPLTTFTDARNGYIVADSCVFGVEVFVLKHTGKGESISLAKAPYISNISFTWEIEKFSELDQESHKSEVFDMGGRDWYLKMYPKGEDGDKGKWLCLYLVPSDWNSQIPTKAGVHAAYKLRIVDQINEKHKERKVNHCFSTANSMGCGSPRLISLEDLHKRPNGYIVKDCLTVEVEFLACTQTEYLKS